MKQWFTGATLIEIGVYKVCCPRFIPGPQSTFYTDRFLIILVIPVILAIQVITIFLEITIAPYQC